MGRGETPPGAVEVRPGGATRAAGGDGTAPRGDRAGDTAGYMPPVPAARVSPEPPATVNRPRPASPLSWVARDMGCWGGSWGAAAAAGRATLPKGAGMGVETASGLPRPSPGQGTR